jgi:hypothetical protein
MLLQRRGPILLQIDTLTSLERFSVEATWVHGGTLSADVAPGNSSLTLPGDGLPTGEGVTLRVYAYTELTLLGDYDTTSPGVGVEIGSESLGVTVQH